jgi:hypothetical protein
VQKVHRKTELLNVLWRRYSARRASRKCASRHRRTENSLSSTTWRKSPLRELHWVAEYPEVSARRLLEKQRARKASEYSPSVEGEEEKNPPRGLSIRGSSGQITLCA